jgi:tetratricopeptide (TPR) repeat protein
VNSAAHPDAALRQALGLHQAGRSGEAIALLQQLLAADARLCPALNILAIIHYQRSEHEQSLHCSSRSLAVEPRQAQTLNNSGLALHELQRYDEALAAYDRAVALNPGYGGAHCNRGITLLALKQPQQALASHERAVALEPKLAYAHYNHGLALEALDRYDEALAAYDRALALEPRLARAWCNRGYLLHQRNRHAEALACYDRAIALDPQCHEAWFNKACVKLVLGEYAEGWSLFERRRQTLQYRVMRVFAEPLWLGETPLAGKTILLHPEEGLGDTLQFCRYVPAVAALGAEVILQAQPALLPLLSTLAGSPRLVRWGAEPPRFDLHCPLMSLPHALRQVVDGIPAPASYLAADPVKTATWRERLGARQGLRVGLAWSGSTTHVHDSQRSLPLAALRPLLRQGVEFHALHKEIRAADRSVLPQLEGLTTHEQALADFSDTAALVEQMDLVLTVDTSVAHLAGALGKPVWIMLPFAPDFRWLLDREDSPWYPRARLFRQGARGDWSGVLARVAAELEALARA